MFIHKTSLTKNNVILHPFLENTTIHITWHEYGFSPVWVLLCNVRVFLCLNVALHISQKNGFSSLCTNLCLLRESSRMKLLKQTLQENSFSPIWIFSWIFREFRNLYVFPQILQVKCPSRILSWVFSCFARFPEFLTSRAQYLQEYVSAFSCTFCSCLFKLLLLLNNLVQYLQEKNFSLLLFSSLDTITYKSRVTQKKLYKKPDAIFSIYG